MTMDETLSILLQQSFSGDKDAYLELLRWLEKHCQTQLSIVLRPYVNFPKEFRQDITQEILLTFHQTHQTFDTNRPFLPWVNSIVRHKTIDFLRRKDFRVQMSGIDIELIKNTWATELEKDPLELKDLEAIINSLPSKQAHIFKLSKVQGLTNGEIATELKMSESNVKVSIHRAVKLLKHLLSAHNK